MKKLNPLLEAVYSLERQEGSISNVSADDPRLKRIADMYKQIDKQPNELSYSSLKILDLLHCGYDIREIANRIGMRYCSVRQNIKNNNLMLRYIVIKDIFNGNIRLFRSVNSMSNTFKKMNIKFGYKLLMYCIDNNKLLDGRYRLYRVKKLRNIKQGAKHEKEYG